MVAASATAILNDIDALHFPRRSFWSAKSCPDRAQVMLAHAFLTAGLNQPVSMPGLGLTQWDAEEEMLGTK
jgi:hypothetical protein